MNLVSCFLVGSCLFSVVCAFTTGPLSSSNNYDAKLQLAIKPFAVSLSSLLHAAATEEVAATNSDVVKGAAAISTLTKRVSTHLTSVEVDSIIPHRYPFALVDKVVELVPGKSAVGVKAVSKNEEFFNGHFPGQPVMPGVLQLEALAQLTGVILNTAEGLEEGTVGFFGSADAVKWKKPVVPGDLLVMEVEVTKFNKKFGIIKASGKGYTDGDLAVQVGEITLVLSKETK